MWKNKSFSSFKIFIFSLLFILGVVWQARAEGKANRNMESYVANVPERYEKNLFELTHYITKPYGNAYEKAQVIAYYIASHMIYEGLQNKEPKKINKRKAKPKKFFKTKTGKSGDFATLFSLMCKQAGVTAGIELGYIERINFLSKGRDKEKVRHAWNYFIYRHRRIYVDTSLMATGRKAISSNIKDDASDKKEADKVKETYAINPFYFDFTTEQEEKLHFSKHVLR